MTLLARTIEALTAAGLACCDHKAWGTLPLYAEGTDERVRVYRTAGKDGDLDRALTVLVAAGLHATLASGRVTIMLAGPRRAPKTTRPKNGPHTPKAAP